MKTTKPVYDMIANDYDKVFVDNLSRAEDKALVKILKPLVKEALVNDGTILDVGCGTGWLLDHIHIPASNYVGFDVSPEMVKRSKSKHKHCEFYEADMKVKWKTKSADLICSLWTVANYDTPKRQIRLTAQTLKPEGKAVFVVHTKGFFREKRRSEGKALPLDCYQQDGWRMWTPKEIREEAKAQGLRVQVIPFRHYDNLPQWLPTFVHSLWLKRKLVLPTEAVFLIAIFTK
jgi:SAM-dependent methyltransferase